MAQAITPAPATKPKKSKKWLWIGIVVIVIVLVAVGGTKDKNVEAPKLAATSFAVDLQNGQYEPAYALMSPAYRQHSTLDNFRSTFVGVDFTKKPPHIYGYSIKIISGNISDTQIAVNFPANAISLDMRKGPNDPGWYVASFIILNSSKY